MPAGDRYVEVRREALTKALEAAGFKVWEPRPGEFGCSELVYVRQHHMDPTMFVKIYTSMPKCGGDARACGADAIRACLVFERYDENMKRWFSGGLYKAPKVLRTGSEEKVIERILERARECYAAGIVRRQRMPGDLKTNIEKVLATAKRAEKHVEAQRQRAQPLPDIERDEEEARAIEEGQV